MSPKGFGQGDWRLRKSEWGEFEETYISGWERRGIIVFTLPAEILETGRRRIIIYTTMNIKTKRTEFVTEKVENAIKSVKKVIVFYTRVVKYGSKWSLVTKG